MRCLADSGVPLSPGGDWRDASATIVATAPELNRRMAALATDLSRRADTPSGDSEPALDRHRRMWEAPLAVGDLPAEPIDNAALAAAVRRPSPLSEVQPRRSPAGKVRPRGG